jgi:hypothetical protein
MSAFEMDTNDNTESFTLVDSSIQRRDKYQNKDTYSDGFEQPDNLDDDDSVVSSTGFSVVAKKKKPVKKKVDKGYRKLKTKDGNLIYFATSMIPGTPIRDAIYGHRFHEYTVGSPNEELFFKVCNASINSSQNVDTLFYDNPEQFESHMNCHVDIDSKNVWAEKYQYALHRVKRNEDKQIQEELEYTVVK